MLFIPKIDKSDDYLKILTDNELKDFVIKTFDDIYERKTVLNFVRIKTLEKLLNCFISFSQHRMKQKNMLR